MRIKITPSNLNGTISAPASKSYAHRLIIACALYGINCEVKNFGSSTDVLTTLDCMKNIGSNFVVESQKVIFKNFKIKNNAVLQCNDCGSSLRFLFPIVGALGINAQFLGTNVLLNRPMQDLFNCLNENGLKIKDFRAEGKLKGVKLNIDASKSSQYISGLLLALPLLKVKTELTVLNKVVSEPYINMTIDILKKFNINIQKNEDKYIVYPCNSKIENKEFFVEGDFSSAAFFLCAGAIEDNISVSNLNINSYQADKYILNALSQFGAEIIIDKNLITVKRKKLNGITIDVENCPDIVQILSVVACFCDGKTVLKNVERLKFKESDRINSIFKMLKTSNIKCEYCDNSIIIYGGKASGGEFYSCNDHRSAMSQTILACYSNNNSIIYNAECVSKSYPNFYDDLKSLGGKINVNI